MKSILLTLSVRPEHIYGHYVQTSETVSDAEVQCQLFAALKIQVLPRVTA